MRFTLHCISDTRGYVALCHLALTHIENCSRLQHTWVDCKTVRTISMRQRVEAVDLGRAIGEYHSLQSGLTGLATCPLISRRFASQTYIFLLNRPLNVPN